MNMLFENQFNIPKKINCGSELLISKNEWVPESEIQGTDEMVLFHPIIKKAFNKILIKFIKKHDIAFVSLCTATRPYSKGRKWKTFKKLYSKYVDLIICSNGGIIPIEYENCYPYLTYDAHGKKQYDKMYIEETYKRLTNFFSAHVYETIIFNFRPGMRNRIAAEMFKKNYKKKSNIYILPSIKIFNEIKKEGFPQGKMFPDLDKRVIEEFNSIIKPTKTIYNIFE